VDNQALQERILSTYNSMRLGMGWIAAVTPILIPLWGYYLFDVSWQNSISAYYFAPNADKWVYSVYPARVLFVGSLFALGSFLFLYKGFSRGEDIALNFAGVFALGVAVCPMYAEAGYIPVSNVLHFTFAVLLFFCMAYAAIVCHDETLRWVKDPNRRARYKVAYHVIGWFMGLFPLVGLILAVSFGAVQRHVFWIEAAGIWAFSAYWFTKSRELEESQVEREALTGRLTQRPPS
jgi:di/tricarboxylate transporter